MDVPPITPLNPDSLSQPPPADHARLEYIDIYMSLDVPTVILIVKLEDIVVPATADPG
jgi:hypothetical protein